MIIYLIQYKQEVMLMNEVIGETYSVAANNTPVRGCTVSKQVLKTPSLGIYYFSLAEDTDISAESYGYHASFLLLCGYAISCISYLALKR